MSSVLFLAAAVDAAAIDAIYAEIEQLEKASAFEEPALGLVNDSLNRFSIGPTGADFLDFKDVVLTRLRTALATAYSDFDTDYACLAYDTLPTPGSFTLTPGTDEIEIEYLAATDATSYKIYRSLTNDINTAVMITETDALTYTDTLLTTGTTYYYWVVAKATGFVDSVAATDNAIPL